MNVRMFSLLKLFAVILFASLVFVGCTNSKRYSISGKITGAEGKMLCFNRLNLSGVERLDSVLLSSSGKFEFSGEKLTEPTFFTLTVGNKNLTLLNDSNINMSVSGSFNQLEDNYQITNSSESVYIKQLNTKLKNTLVEIEVLKEKYRKASSESERVGVLNEINYKLDKHKEFVSEFITNHPRSFASYYAIYQKIDNETFIFNVFDKKDQRSYAAIATSLNVYYPNNERVAGLYNFVLNAKKQEKSARITELMKVLPTIGYPDLKIADKSGREIALSAFKGKVVLLTFWASWNKDSRAFNSELRRVNKKFGSRGFEIYQVSLDQNKVYWELAMLQDELTWTNVCEFTFPNAYSASIYDVTSLPANFLISKSGEIVGRNLDGALLDEKISNNL